MKTHQPSGTTCACTLNTWRPSISSATTGSGFSATKASGGSGDRSSSAARTCASCDMSVLRSTRLISGCAITRPPGSTTRARPVTPTLISFTTSHMNLRLTSAPLRRRQGWRVLKARTQRILFREGEPAVHQPLRGQRRAYDRDEKGHVLPEQPPARRGGGGLAPHVPWFGLLQTHALPRPCPQA